MLTSINLKAARIAAKLSQEDAAKALNVTRGTISSYENGKSKPSIETIQQLCRLYSFNICLLTDAEYGILQGIVPFLAKNGGKEGKKRE
jgi:DNA-binding XRE family transcriptional regulator